VFEVQLAGRRRIIRHALAIIAVVMLAACADKRGGPIPYNVQGFGLPDSPKVVPLEENYRIAPLDTLNVRVFKMADLTGDYEVDLTGKISMPLVGEISAIDLTTARS
jgi:polysaccharide export outer membrane protein